MTPEELAAIEPDEIRKLSDEELGRLVTPLLPVVRQEYIGKGEETVLLPASGQKASRKSIDREVATLQRLLKAHSAK